MTAPPVLDLTADALDRPIKMDLVTVEAMMLWPDDEAKRSRWWTGAMIEEGRARLDDMPAALLRNYTREALDAPRLPELQREANRRAVDGLLAGRVVLTSIKGPAPRYQVLEAVCEHLRDTHQVRPQTLNNKVMPTFRPVAHLWAAHMLACERGDQTFPCKLCDLRAFLAVAEAIRALAEEKRVKKAPKPIMRPGEAVRLQDDLAAILPRVRLDIA